MDRSVAFWRWLPDADPQLGGSLRAGVPGEEAGWLRLGLASKDLASRFVLEMYYNRRLGGGQPSGRFSFVARTVLSTTGRGTMETLCMLNKIRLIMPPHARFEWPSSSVVLPHRFSNHTMIAVLFMACSTV